MSTYNALFVKCSLIKAYTKPNLNKKNQNVLKQRSMLVTFCIRYVYCDWCSGLVLSSCDQVERIVSFSPLHFSFVVLTYCICQHNDKLNKTTAFLQQRNTGTAP